MSDLERFEPVPGVRFKVAFEDGAEWIIARAPKNWFVIPFLCIWLLGWTAGGIAALTQFLQGEEQAFLGFWLVMWAFGWAFAASWVVWQVAGRMRVTVQGQALVYRWSMPAVGRTRRYDVRHVREVRAGRAAWPWSGGMMNLSAPPFLSRAPGSVQFDYGGRTINLMPGLDEAEGQAIVDWLDKRLPR